MTTLEAELATLHGKQAGLLFTSGFVSNQAALSTILNSFPHGPDLPGRCSPTPRTTPR